MHYQPEHIKKREINDIQKIKHKYKSKKETLSHSIKSKMLQYKDTCYSWTEFNIDNSKIGPWGRYLLSVQFNFFFLSWPFSDHPLAAPLSPTKMGAKCLSAVMLDNQDRALSQRQKKLFEREKDIMTFGM